MLSGKRLVGPIMILQLACYYKGKGLYVIFDVLIGCYT